MVVPGFNWTRKWIKEPVLVHGFIKFWRIDYAFCARRFPPTGLQGEYCFWIILCTVYGVSRLIAGYTTWMMKKWGIAFGAALSITTMTVAPSIYPFGIIDTILTVISLASILLAWFGDEKL